MGRKDKEFFARNSLSLNTASKQLCAYLIVIKKIIPDQNVWDTFVKRLCTMMKKYPFVRMDYYGFVGEWRKVLGIKEEYET